MRWQDLLIDAYGEVQKVLEQALDGLTQEELKQQPHPDCNNIGWMTWHMIRVHDDIISGNMGEEQLWIKDKWHEKFGRDADPKDTGGRNTSEEVAAFKPPDVSTILDYHRAVLERSKKYINGLSEADLDREVEGPLPNVATRLNVILSDSLQHAGQVAYLVRDECRRQSIRVVSRGVLLGDDDKAIFL